MNFEITTKDMGRDHLRQLLVNGEVASQVHVIDYVMNVRSTRFAMAGWGGVETRPAFRKKGLSKALLEDTVRYMKEKGYDFSVLFGIPNYYHRYAFATSLIDESRAIAPSKPWTEGTADEPEEISADEFVKSGKVRDIYSEVNEGWNGTIHRDETDYEVLLKDKYEEFSTFTSSIRFFVTDEGYAIIRDDMDKQETSVLEIGARDISSYLSLFKKSAQIAWDAGRDHFQVNIPPDHPCLSALRKWGYRAELSYSFDAGAMARTVNLKGVLEKLPRYFDGLSISDGEETYRVKGEEVKDARGEEEVISLTPGQTAQIIMGYVKASAVGALPPRTASTLESKFSETVPYMWWVDHFRKRQLTKAFLNRIDRTRLFFYHQSSSSLTRKAGTVWRPRK